MYEFIDVMLGGGFKSGKTDAFDKCKEIIKKKSSEGWELVQIVPVLNEKWSAGALVKYTIVFKINK